MPGAYPPRLELQAQTSQTNANTLSRSSFECILLYRNELDCVHTLPACFRRSTGLLCISGGVSVHCTSFVRPLLTFTFIDSIDLSAKRTPSHYLFPFRCPLAFVAFEPFIVIAALDPHHCLNSLANLFSLRGLLSLSWIINTILNIDGQRIHSDVI
jgi:hypothetical protein